MRALLIDPATRAVEVVDIAGREDIVQIIGFDTLESDAVGTEGDRLWFDEECFLRGTGARFQVDTVIPISGKALQVGTAADGLSLHDTATTPESLRGRIKYL